MDQYEDAHLIPALSKSLRGAFGQWACRMFPRGTTHVMSFSLMPPNIPFSVSRWNFRTRLDRHDLVRIIVSRLDRVVHGSGHDRKEDAKKFPYFITTETRNKFGSVVPAHLHGGFAIPEDRLDRFYNKWPTVGNVIDLDAKKLGFHPDLMLQVYYANSGLVENYDTKGLYYNVGETWNRNTISHL